jgi:hypothetical protein
MQHGDLAGPAISNGNSQQKGHCEYSYFRGGTSHDEANGFGKTPLMGCQWYRLSIGPWDVQTWYKADVNSKCDPHSGMARISNILDSTGRYDAQKSLLAWVRAHAQ